MFRLKELRLEAGLKRSELSEILGIHQNTLANYENETRQAPYELLILFSDYFDVSIDYLLGRDGQNMFKAKETKSISPLSVKEKELIEVFRQCHDKGKSRILEYARMWQQKPDWN